MSVCVNILWFGSVSKAIYVDIWMVCLGRILLLLVKDACQHLYIRTSSWHSSFRRVLLTITKEGMNLEWKNRDKYLSWEWRRAAFVLNRWNRLNYVKIVDKINQLTCIFDIWRRCLNQQVAITQVSFYSRRYLTIDKMPPSSLLFIRGAHRHCLDFIRITLIVQDKRCSLYSKFIQCDSMHDYMCYEMTTINKGITYISIYLMMLFILVSISPKYFRLDIHSVAAEFTA